MLWEKVSLFFAGDEKQGSFLKFHSDKHFLYYLVAPRHWTDAWWKEAMGENDPIILDLTNLHEISLEGRRSLEALMHANAWAFGLSKRMEKKIGEDALLPIYDHLFENKATLLNRFEGTPGYDHFYWSFEKENGIDRICFFGPLDSRLDRTNVYNDIVGRLSSSSYIIDFALCPFMNSSGLGFLLRLIKHNERLQRTASFIGFNPQIQQTLRLARLEHLLKSDTSL